MLLAPGEAAWYLERGDAFAAKKQFNKAIAEYTKALEREPDLPVALSSRALTYERKGDKTSAIRDYCRILIVDAARDSLRAARERIAQLTGQAPVANPSTPPAGAPTTTLQPVSPPPTSAITKSRRKNAIAPFTIETEEGANYLIKLVNVAAKKTR